MKTITIAGVGALGSHLVLFIRSIPDIRIRIIDFDRVESKNMKSQFHGLPGSNKLKVHSLSQTMNFMFSSKIDILCAKLTDDNKNQLLDGSDLIVDCLDNRESRVIIQKYSREHNTPCLHGALAANGAFGRVCWDENFVIDEETPGAVTCDVGDFLPFIGIVSTYLAQATKEFMDNGVKIGYQISPHNCFSFK